MNTTPDEELAIEGTALRHMIGDRQPLLFVTTSIADDNLVHLSIAGFPGTVEQGDEEAMRLAELNLAGLLLSKIADKSKDGVGAAVRAMSDQMTELFNDEQDRITAQRGKRGSR